MNEPKHDQNPHQRPNHNKVHHDSPYWTRAHRDWRVVVGVVLMLVALAVYLMTGDLSGWGRSATPQPQPVAPTVGR